MRCKVTRKLTRQFDLLLLVQLPWKCHFKFTVDT